MYQAANRWMKKPTTADHAQHHQRQRVETQRELRREAVDIDPGPQELRIRHACWRMT